MDNINFLSWRQKKIIRDFYIFLIAIAATIVMVSSISLLAVHLENKKIVALNKNMASWHKKNRSIAGLVRKKETLSGNIAWSIKAKQSLEQQYRLLNSLTLCPECDIAIEKNKNLIVIHGETNAMPTIENIIAPLKNLSFVKKIDSKVNGTENKNKINLINFSLFLTLGENND